MDLAELIACKRWVAVLDYIDMLPTASRYAEAVTNDPERAFELANRPAPTEKWTPPVSEYSVLAIFLRDAVNELRTHTQHLVALGHNKPQPIQLVPGPRTGIDRAVDAMERQHVEDLAGLLGFSPEDLW